MKKQNIYASMEEDIKNSGLSEEAQQILYKNFLKLKDQKVNLMITGATGCGKSSTINAMFNTDIAKVGVGSDPETMDIQKYDMGNLVLWDTPGLGDGKEKDRQHAKAIISKLSELDKNHKPLIDLVLVILDGGSRDLGTSYELINSVIIPNLGENAKRRILVAINQADMAMKGKYWDEENNKPEPKLEKFLDGKVLSVKNRVKEATGVDIEPIYFSAGFKDEDEEQRPYNLSKLLYFIVSNTPTKKRLAYADNISSKKQAWESDDGLKEYAEETRKSMAETVTEYASKGADIGADIGKVFGSTGKAIGRTVGAVVGAVVGFISSWF